MGKQRLSPGEWRVWLVWRYNQEMSARQVWELMGQDTSLGTVDAALRAIKTRVREAMGEHTLLPPTLETIRQVEGIGQDPDGQQTVEERLGKAIAKELEKQDRVDEMLREFLDNGNDNNGKE